MDKDTYLTTMPQALKLLEKFKAENSAVANGRTDAENKSGVAFAQTDNWVANITCHHCGVKGHRVNDCLDLTNAQRKKFWDDCNAANQVETATLELKICSKHGDRKSVVYRTN